MASWFGRFLRPAFVHPLPHAPSTAVLVPWFGASSARHTVFDPHDREALARFEPAVIAGLLPDLEALRVHPTHALIVFTAPEEPLSREARDRLWDLHGVPVFEQIVAPGGRVIAAECEGHEGLHLLGSAQNLPGSELRRGRCRCGKDVLRVFLPAPEPELTALSR